MATLSTARSFVIRGRMLFRDKYQTGNSQASVRPPFDYGAVLIKRSTSSRLAPLVA